ARSSQWNGRNGWKFLTNTSLLFSTRIGPQEENRAGSISWSAGRSAASAESPHYNPGFRRARTSPHPCPLPQGEGEAVAALSTIKDLEYEAALQIAHPVPEAKAVVRGKEP